MPVTTPTFQDAKAKTITGVPVSYTGLFLALHTADPTSAGTVGEVTGGSYARQPLTLAFVSNGVVQNPTDIDFPGMPAVTVTHTSVKTAVTGGSTLIYGPVTGAGDAVLAGQTYRVAAAQAQYTEGA